MKTISQAITDFATLAIQAGGWMELDRLYLQNRIMAMIGEEKQTQVKQNHQRLESNYAFSFWIF